MAEDWKEQEEREQGLHSVIWAASKGVLNRDHRFVIEWDVSEDTSVDYNRLFKNKQTKSTRLLGEMVEWLRGHTTLPEDRSLFPRTYIPCPRVHNYL